MVALTDIPLSVTLDGIFPYLNRLEWNSLASTCHELHDASKHLLPPWPENCELQLSWRYTSMSSPIWSPDGRSVACLENIRIHIFDQHRVYSIKQWVAHDRWNVSSIQYSPDGGLLASTGDDTHVRVWDCNNLYECIRDWKLGDKNSSSNVAFSNDGKLLAVSMMDSVHLFEVENDSPQPIKSVQLRHESITTREMIFTKDDSRLLFGGNDYDHVIRKGVIKIWNLAANDRITTKNVPLDSINPSVKTLVMSPDGSKVAAASASGILSIWKLVDDDLTCLHVIVDQHQGALSSLTFTPDNKYVVSGCGEDFPRCDGMITFWTVEDGSRSVGYTSSYCVYALHYSPDGSRLLVQDGSCVFVKSLSPVGDDDKCDRMNEYLGRTGPIMLNFSA